MANFIAGDVLSLKKTVLACALALGAAGAAVAGPSVVVFDSLSSTPLNPFDYIAGPIGDPVTLAAGTPRNFSGYQTYVYNEGQSAVTTDLTLTIFDVTGTTALFSVVAPVTAAVGGPTLVSVDCMCGVLPDQLMFELSLANGTDLGFGIDVSGTPAVGSDNTPVDGTVSLRINAVPEPSTFALGALGLFAAFRRRKA